MNKKNSKLQSTNNTAFLLVDKVNKIYKTKHQQEVHALKDVSFTCNKGEFIVILGQSGAGKTTLLNCIGGMDNITSGTIVLNGNDISKASAKQLTEYRRNDIGFVFQFYNLMQNLTAIENVELATEISKKAIDPKSVMKQVGLEDRINNFPAQLSGGEQQRVSIARAIAKNPSILLCDEPTGALDFKTGKLVIQVLYDACKINEKTVIVVTHNSEIAAVANKVIHISNGQISKIEVNKHPKDIKDIV